MSKLSFAVSEQNQYHCYMFMLLINIMHVPGIKFTLANLLNAIDFELKKVLLPPPREFCRHILS